MSDSKKKEEESNSMGATPLSTRGLPPPQEPKSEKEEDTVKRLTKKTKKTRRTGKSRRHENTCQHPILFGEKNYLWKKMSVQLILEKN